MMVPATISREGQQVNGPREVSMARRRYQKGSLVPNRGLPANGFWKGRWREDVMQPDGTITRPYKWEVLGTIQDYPTRKLALRALEARLSTINSPTYRARPTATFAEFANRWDATVLSQHKPSTQSSTHSQLRRCCRNWAVARSRIWTDKSCKRLFPVVAATRKRSGTWSRRCA